MKKFKKSKDIIYNPKTKSNINIIHISDLHYSNLITENTLSRIIKKIKDLNPDYIVITGDTIDNTKSINNKTKETIILNFFKELGSITKTIISLGNHDFYKFNNRKIVYEYPKEFWKKIENIPNVYLLNNKSYKNQEIEFFGYSALKEYYYPHKKRREDKNIMLDDLKTLKDYLKESQVPKIGLFHSPHCITQPEIIEELQNFDIILSGHMHNGCVFPILDDLWKSNRGIINANKNLFPNNCRGKILKKYKNKNINVIISGGLTTFSSQAIKILHPFDNMFVHHINQIIITNNKDKITDTTYKYEK